MPAADKTKVICAVLQMKMKKSEPTTSLIINAAVCIALGVVCLSAGLIAHPASTDTQRMFQSGNWSVQAVMAKTAIRSMDDLATKKEKMLFGAFFNTNKECIGLADSCVKASRIFIFLGVLMVLVGFRIVWLAHRIRKKLAEPAGSDYRATRSV